MSSEKELKPEEPPANKYSSKLTEEEIKRIVSQAKYARKRLAALKEGTTPPPSPRRKGGKKTRRNRKNRNYTKKR